ncbi:MAG: hypothetical protein QOG42_444, partial [Solirubrobacteraceae bacterium]|nr:hypothetical protein [Solirubrobacteraceae bacterium]
MSEAARSCPACGADALAPWRIVPGSDPALPGEYALARCARCGSAVTLDPAPPAAHEAGAYGGGAPRGSSLAAPLLRAFDRRRQTCLARAGARPPGRLLDV